MSRQRPLSILRITVLAVMVGWLFVPSLAAAKAGLPSTAALPPYPGSGAATQGRFEDTAHPLPKPAGIKHAEKPKPDPGMIALEINGMSYHWNRKVVRRRHLHEFNPGVGISYEKSGWLATAGYYSNSYGKSSFYVMGGPIWHVTSWLQLGVGVGVISGYERDSGMPWTPLITPVMRIWRINLVTTPWCAAASFTLFRFQD